MKFYIAGLAGQKTALTVCHDTAPTACDEEVRITTPCGEFAIQWEDGTHLSILRIHEVESGEVKTDCLDSWEVGEASQ